MTAPSGTIVQQGWTASDPVGASDIAPCSLVKIVSGLLVVCGSGDRPTGVTGGEVLKANSPVGNYWAWIPGQVYYVLTSGSPSAGNFLKCGATGAAVAETSPTTVTAFTIGYLDGAVDANGGGKIRSC